MPRNIRTKPAVCAICAKPFMVKSSHPTQKYCGQSCAKSAQYAIYAAARRIGDEGDLPPDIYKPLPPGADQYTATCSLCAEQIDKRLTPEEARALRPMFCPRCGARMFVTRTDRSLGGSVDPSVPLGRINQHARPVPRRSVA